MKNCGHAVILVKIRHTCVVQNTLRPSAVTATMCRMDDSPGGIGAMCTTAAPLISVLLLPPNISEPPAENTTVSLVS